MEGSFVCLLKWSPVKTGVMLGRVRVEWEPNHGGRKAVSSGPGAAMRREGGFV